MPFSSGRAHSWAQFLRWSLTSAEFRGTIPALILLATLLLAQVRMSLALATWAHLVHVQPLLIRNPRSFSAENPPSHPCPRLWCCCDPRTSWGLEPLTSSFSPLCQPVQIPLQSLRTLQQTSTCLNGAASFLHTDLSWFNLHGVVYNGKRKH